MTNSNSPQQYDNRLITFGAVYWIVYAALTFPFPAGPLTWAVTVFFAFIGTPLSIAIVCGLKFFAKTPFSSQMLSGFILGMFCLAGFFVCAFAGAIIPGGGMGR